MYLDADGHVKWEGVGAYTDEAKMLAFVRTFPGADMSVIRKVVPAKQKLLSDLISGRRFFTINDVRQERSEAEKERDAKELEVWAEIGGLIA